MDFTIYYNKLSKKRKIYIKYLLYTQHNYIMVNIIQIS